MQKRAVETRSEMTFCFEYMKDQTKAFFNPSQLHFHGQIQTKSGFFGPRSRPLYEENKLGLFCLDVPQKFSNNSIQPVLR